MAEHVRNEVCVDQITRLRKDLDNHISEAPEFRDKVIKHEGQISTLKDTQEKIMDDTEAIKLSVENLKSDIREYRGEVKIWVLSGILGTVVVFAIPTFTLFYDAGQKSKEIEIYTKRVEILEGVRK